MECTACQFENPTGQKFCGQCGVALARLCPACGFQNQPSFNYCGDCGTALSEPAASPAGPDSSAGRDSSGSPATSDAAPVRDYNPRRYTPRHLAEKILRDKAALEGERKHVTVMFADLAGSTAFASGIDPEEMHGLMDRAFKIILEQVHRYEGTVNQFTGDGVMALFGAPIAIEDAPRCALVAALAIQRELASLDAEVQQQYGRRFQMRIGIHSGPVVVGKIGDDLRMDYTAVGDTTNLAARLEQLAEPGSVLISSATRRQVEGFFDLATLPPAHVKGKPDPIEIFEVKGERGVRGRIEALAEGELTPFVGREPQVELLMEAMASARAGHGQVCFIVGEAGIGKSRLLHEFRQRLGDVSHTWIEGRCASYAQMTPFHAVADGLRRRFGIDDRDDEEAAGAKIDSAERDTGGGLEWTLPFMRALLSLPAQDPEIEALDAMTRRSESGRALSARMMRIAQRELLVFVIEDLHWIDAASEEFLGFLAESIPAARVLLILTHRPGYEHSFGDRSYHVRVPLQPLSSGAMDAMVGSILESQQLPIGLRELIEQKAEGNPLFVEEVVRSLLEEGIVKIEEGSLSLARDLADIMVPDRIQDVLMARLDRLEEGPKRAIQIASVIGREFAMRLLQRISEAGEGIDEIVGELRALELIYQKASHPELAYMFKHALTHDVAYQSVLVGRRKVLHGVVGSAIEELYRDRLVEHYEALAHHFTEANVWEQAFRYHELASEKSLAAYANHAAADHCRRALEMADRLGEGVPLERRRALLERLGNSTLLTSDFRGSGEAFEAAARLIDVPATRALFLGRAAFGFLWSHHYDKSRALEQEGTALAEAHEAVGAQAFCLTVHDETELVQGRSLSNNARADQALALAERSRDPEILVAVLSHVGQRSEWQGDYKRTIALTGRAVEIAAQQRSPMSALFGQWFLAIASVAMGDYGRGIGVLRGGIDLCDRIGDSALTSRLLNTMGWAYAEIGSHARAAEYNRRGTEMAAQIVDLGLVAGAPELYANAAINLSGNLTALGDVGAARDVLAPIEEDLVASDDPWMRWRYELHVMDARGRMALAVGDADLCLAHAEEELRGARQVFARKLEARALELVGRSLLVQDERDRAEEALGLALGVARDISYPPVIWRAESLLGELARRRGEDAAAERHFAAVSRIVEEKARSLSEPELRRELLGLGERILADPLNSYR